MNISRIYTTSFENKEIKMTETEKGVFWEYDKKDLGSIALEKIFFPSNSCTPETQEFIFNLKDPEMIFNDFIVEKIFLGNEEYSSKLLRDLKIATEQKEMSVYDYFGSIISLPFVFAITSAFSIFTQDNIFDPLCTIRQDDKCIKKLKKIKKFVNKKIELIDKYKSPFYIEIKPKDIAESKICKNMLVNKFFWCITMLTNNAGNDTGNETQDYLGSAGSIGILGDQHALFVVEGINNGYFSKDNERVRKDGYFCYLGELRAPIKDMDDEEKKKQRGAQGKLLDYTKEIRYSGKTETFIRASEKIVKIFDSVEEDKKKKIKLSRMGNKSYFEDGSPTCFNWVQEKFAMIHIDLGSSITEKLFVLPKNYTQPSIIEIREKNTEKNLLEIEKKINYGSSEKDYNLIEDSYYSGDCGSNYGDW